MRRTPTLEATRRVLRARICQRCRNRPPGGEALCADVPRSCEATCPLFVHLPVLRQYARQLDPMVRSREDVLGKLARSMAKADATPSAIPPATPSATDKAAGKSSSPLTRYRKQVVGTLTTLYGH